MHAQELGFREDPFSELPDPRFVYRHRGFRAVCADLLYARMSERQGLTLVTGAEGSGKTTLLEMLVQERASSDCYHAIAGHRKLSFEKLLRQAIEVLGLVQGEQAQETERGECIEFLTDFVLDTSARGGRVIFLIDRAEALPAETLQSLAELAYLGEGDGRLLQLILAVRTEPGDHALPPGYRGVADDIAFQFHIAPLEPDEVESYLKHRLEVASYSGADLFDEAAFQALATISGGNPLRINRIARVALQLSQAEDLEMVADRTIGEAAAQCAYLDPPPPDPGFPDEDGLSHEHDLTWSQAPEGPEGEPGPVGSEPDDLGASDLEEGEDGEPRILDFPGHRSAGGASPDAWPPLPGDDPNEFVPPLSEPDLGPAARQTDPQIPEDDGQEDDRQRSWDDPVLELDRPADEADSDADREALLRWDAARRAERDRGRRPWPLSGGSAGTRSGGSVWLTRGYALLAILCLGVVLWWYGGKDDPITVELSNPPTQSPVEPLVESDRLGSREEPATAPPSSPQAPVREAVQAAPAPSPSVQEQPPAGPGLAVGALEGATTDLGPAREASLEERLAALDQKLVRVVTQLEALSASLAAEREEASGLAQDQSAEQTVPAVEELKAQIAALAKQLERIQADRDRLRTAGATAADADTDATSTAGPADLADTPSSPATEPGDPLQENQGSARLALLLPPATPSKPENVVADLQEMLIQLGYKIGNPDGRLGGRTKRAIEKYQRDHGLPTEGTVSQELRHHMTAFTLLKEAVVRYHEGRLQRALDDYNAVLKLQPGDRETQMLRGLVYMRLGYVDQAVHDLEHPVPEDGGASTFAFYRPGRVYYIQERLQALGLDPGRTDGLMVRQTEDAIISYERSFGLPLSGQPSASLLRHMEIQDLHAAAVADYRTGDYAAALERYNIVLALQPNDPEVYFNRGLTYKVLGMPDEALADYRKATALDPGLSKAYYDRGNIRWERGDYQLALADYWSAFKGWW